MSRYAAEREALGLNSSSAPAKQSQSRYAKEREAMKYPTEIIPTPVPVKTEPAKEPGLFSKLGSFLSDAINKFNPEDNVPTAIADPTPIMQRINAMPQQEIVSPQAQIERIGAYPSAYKPKESTPSNNFDTNTVIPDTVQPNLSKIGAYGNPNNNPKADFDSMLKSFVSAAEYLNTGMADTNKAMVNIPRKVQEGWGKLTGTTDSDPFLKGLNSVYNTIDKTTNQFDEAHKNDSGAMKLIGGALRSVPMMVTAGVAGAGIAPAATGITKVASQIAPFGSLAGSQYMSEAEKEGATLGQQVTYGILGGLAESLTEAPFMTRWIARVGGDKAIINGAESLMKRYGKKGLEFLKDVGSEAFQEAAVDPMTALAKRATYKPDEAIFQWGQMGQDAAGGAVMAVMLMALGLPAGAVSRKLAEKMVKEGHAPTIQEAQEIQQQVEEDYSNINNEQPIDNTVVDNKPVDNVSTLVENFKQAADVVEGVKPNVENTMIKPGEIGSAEYFDNSIKQQQENPGIQQNTNVEPGIQSQVLEDGVKLPPEPVVNIPKEPINNTPILPPGPEKKVVSGVKKTNVLPRYVLGDGGQYNTKKGWVKQGVSGGTRDINVKSPNIIKESPKVKEGTKKPVENTPSQPPLKAYTEEPANDKGQGNTTVTPKAENVANNTPVSYGKAGKTAYEKWGRNEIVDADLSKQDDPYTQSFRKFFEYWYNKGLNGESRKAFESVPNIQHYFQPHLEDMFLEAGRKDAANNGSEQPKLPKPGTKAVKKEEVKPQELQTINNNGKIEQKVTDKSKADTVKVIKDAIISHSKHPQYGDISDSQIATDILDRMRTKLSNKWLDASWLGTTNQEEEFSDYSEAKNKYYPQILKLIKEVRSSINNKEGDNNADTTKTDAAETATTKVSTPKGEIKGTKGNGHAEQLSSDTSSKGDNQEKPIESEVQRVQNTDEQILRNGDATSSINEGGGNSGTNRTDTDSVPNDKTDGVSGNEVTTGNVENKSPKERLNLKLNVEEDWLHGVSKNNSDYGLVRLRQKMNQQALDILDKPESEITDEDKQILKNYTGKGGIGETGREILTQYFTDYKTVDIIYKKITEMGFGMDNIKALDPSTGVGVFMGLAPDGVTFDAIDIDPISAKIAKILYPDSKVMNKGFESHRVDNAYDLVITNVPFSATRGDGVTKDKPQIKALHDYFMLAALDKAKDNGLIVMITPSSVMDGVDNRIRKMITKDAEFITSYRLPDSVFKKTGTDVVTDVIFLRRRVRDSFDENVKFENNDMFEDIQLVGKDDIEYTSWHTKVKSDIQIALNSYYMANPDNILGAKAVTYNRYGQPIIKVKGDMDETSITRMLNDDIKYIPSTASSKTTTDNNSNIIYLDPTDIAITPIGGLFEKDGKWWRRSQKKNAAGVIKDTAEEMTLTKDEIATVKELHKVAAVSQLLRVVARSGKGNISNLTKELKAKVDAFSKKSGKNFKDKKFIEKISSDPRYYIVKTLTENPDIFKTDTLSVREYKIPLEDVKNLDMLSKHLINKYGKITVKNFADNYQGGISIDKARELLDNSKDFYKAPKTYEVEEHDTLGNVTYKRVKDSEYSYERKADYLSGNIYKKIDFAKQEIEDGNKEFERNLKDLQKVIPTPKTLKDTTISLKAKWLDTNVIEKFISDYLDSANSVVYDEISREFVVRMGYSNNEKTRSLKIDKHEFKDWFEKFLNGKDLSIFKDGEKDLLASSAATKKMRLIDEYFKSYLNSNPEISGPILDNFNRIFNNWVDKDYKNEQLVIPGANKAFKFRGNQLEFVNMAISLGSAINAQRTGAGKTATNAAVNQMLKVTGRANKPVAVVPGKVIKKFVRDIKYGSRGLPSIFPDMNILDVTDYSYNEAMAKIAFNEWDLILMPDTWFKKIPVTPERESVYIQDMIDDLIRSENARALDKGSKRSQKDFEARMLKLEARLAELRNYVKNDGIYFEDLGIDAISLDEAQSVKNLVASAKGSDLGMSATPSQVALDFNMKAKYIMEKKNGKNIFMYTATPVSNSMLEIYGLLQNIAPNEWVDRGIYTPDDFIEAMADTSETIGITSSNELGVVNKVDGFKNIDELRSLFRKYVDYRPFIEGTVIPDVEETRYSVAMNDWQRIYFKEALDRLQLIKGKEPMEFISKNGMDVVLDTILKVLGDVRRASLSPSLITGEKPTLENSPKIALGIEVASKIYKETGKNQVIFLDEYGETNLGNNNLHNFMRDELVKAGVPKNEIIIVNGKVNSAVEKKLQIQDDFNDGKYKIIIGTTESIGAGMDLQENTVAILNFDIPWTPTSVMQRRGRGERPGNINKLIANINIYTKGSYDAWSSSIVGIKKKWQDQLLEGEGDSVNGYLVNQDNDNYDIDTIIAELMEDPFEKEQHTIAAEKKNIESIINELKGSKRSVEKQIEDVSEAIKERESKVKGYQKELVDKPDGKMAPLMIEKLTKTIQGMESELVEFGTKRDGIVDTIKLKESELERIINNADQRLEAAKLKRVTGNSAGKEKNDIPNLVKNLKKANGKTQSKNEIKHESGKLPPGGVASSVVKSDLLNQMNNAGNSEQVIKRSDIEKFVSEFLDIPVAQGKFRQRALGIFKIKPEVIRLKKTKDIDTLFHEVGHFFDKKYKFSESRKAAYKDELMKLGQPVSLKSYTQTQVRGEGVAEFMRLYLLNDAHLKVTSPKFYSHFERIVSGNAEYMNLINTLKVAVENYRDQNPETRILSNVSVDGKEGYRNMTLDRFYTIAVDELQPIKAAVQRITGGKTIGINDDPYKLAWLFRGWQGKAETFLKHGTIDEDFNKIGKGFEEIMKPIGKDIDNFRAYIVAKRAEELQGRGIETGLQANDVAATLSKFAGKGYDTIMDELIEYQDAVMQQLVETGILSQDSVNAMRQLNKEYVPFYRVIENIKGGTGKGLLGRNPVKSIKGSTRDIIDPLESIIKNTYLITNMAEKNRVGRALVDLANKFEGSGKILDKVPPKMIGQSFTLEEIQKALEAAGADVTNMNLDQVAAIFRPMPYGSKDKVITVFKDGKAEYYEVFDEELYRGMLAMDKETTAFWIRLLSFPASVLRAGAVLTPEFATRNPMRDSFSAFIYSKYGFIPGVDTVRGLFHTVMKDDLYYKAMASGALNGATVSLDRDYLQKNLRGMLKRSMKDKTLNIITHPVDVLRAFSELTENATRIGNFARGIKKEGTSTEGIRNVSLATRDVALDFSRYGTATKQINKAVAFFNAQLQGVDKMARAFIDDPWRTTWRTLLAVTLPSILLYLRNRDDDRYQELPQWQKDLFWIIITKDVIYRIPKPFELGLIFGTGAERIMKYIDENDPAAFKDYGVRIRDAFTPNFIPTAMLPLLEATSNYSFFTGRGIDTQADKMLNPDQRYGEYTSEVAKLAGKAFNESPKIIDNTIRGYGGGLAKYGTDVIDSALKATGAVKALPKPTKDITDLPGIKGITIKPYVSSESMNTFYDRLGKLESDYKTAVNKNEITGLWQFKDRAELRDLRDSAEQLSKLRKKVDDTYKNTKINPDEKRDQLRQINFMLMNVARKALGKHEIKQ